MVPDLGPWQLIGLAAVVVAVTAGLLWLSSRPRLLPGGVMIRLLCPADVKEALIRVGKNPVTGSLSVLWCDRFPGGTITCNRACFTDEIAGSAV